MPHVATRSHTERKPMADARIGVSVLLVANPPRRMVQTAGMLTQTSRIMRKGMLPTSCGRLIWHSCAIHE